MKDFVIFGIVAFAVFFLVRFFLRRNQKKKTPPHLSSSDMEIFSSKMEKLKEEKINSNDRGIPSHHPRPFIDESNRAERILRERSTNPISIRKPSRREDKSRQVSKPAKRREDDSSFDILNTPPLPFDAPSGSVGIGSRSNSDDSWSGGGGHFGGAGASGSWDDNSNSSGSGHGSSYSSSDSGSSDSGSSSSDSGGSSGGGGD